MANARLPEGWEYTGRTVQRGIESGGILRHFYYDAQEHNIYRVMRVKRQRQGGELPGIMKFNPDVSVDITYISRTSRRAFPDLDVIFHDKEVRKKR